MNREFCIFFFIWFLVSFINLCCTISGGLYLAYQSVLYTKSGDTPRTRLLRDIMPPDIPSYKHPPDFVPHLITLGLNDWLTDGMRADFVVSALIVTAICLSKVAKIFIKNVSSLKMLLYGTICNKNWWCTCKLLAFLVLLLRHCGYWYSRLLHGWMLNCNLAID